MNPQHSSQSHVEIRPFIIEDYDEVLNLWRRAGLPFKPRGRDRKDRIKTEIEGNHTFFLLAELEGQVIGSILANHEGRKGWIHRLAVHPDHRRRGLARILLREAENHLREAGIEMIASLIEEDNKTSMIFFEQAGYIKHPDIIYLTKKKNPYA